MPGKWINGKYYADAANAPGGRYNPGGGDIYLDPGLDTSKLDPGSPLAGLRAAAADRAMKPGDPLGPSGIRIPGVPEMPYPPAPRSAFAPSDLPIPGLPDPNDPGVIEGEGMPAAPEQATGSEVPGLSWRWGSKGAPSASQLADQRAAFLATGSSPEISMMADAARGRELVDENLRNRPDLLNARMALARLKQTEAGTPEGKAAERQRIRDEADADMAMKGLARAKMGSKIAAEEAQSGPMAFLDPRSGRARYLKAEEVWNLIQNPRAQAIAAQEHQREMEKAGVSAIGRWAGSPMGSAMFDPNMLPDFLGMSGGSQGGGPETGAGPATQVGGPMVVSKQQLQTYATRQGISYQQALDQAKAEGIEVR